MNKTAEVNSSEGTCKVADLNVLLLPDSTTPSKKKKKKKHHSGPGGSFNNSPEAHGFSRFQANISAKNWKADCLSAPCLGKRRTCVDSSVVLAF
jgi:hypothetical protein